MNHKIKINLIFFKYFLFKEINVLRIESSQKWKLLEKTNRRRFYNFYFLNGKFWLSVLNYPVLISLDKIAVIRQW